MNEYIPPQADEDDVAAAFYGLLDGYVVVHKACGKACTGIAFNHDPDAGYFRCPLGCSGNWTYPDVLTEVKDLYDPYDGWSRRRVLDDFVLRTHEEASGQPILGIVWDFTTKPAHSKLTEITDPEQIKERNERILKACRAKTRKALARR